MRWVSLRGARPCWVGGVLWSSCVCLAYRYLSYGMGRVQWFSCLSHQETPALWVGS
jgi:hypothetical protein